MFCFPVNLILQIENNIFSIEIRNPKTKLHDVLDFLKVDFYEYLIKSLRKF